MKKYSLIILGVVLVVCSIFIGSLSSTKFKIISSSIPKEIKKGETFQIEVNTRVEKSEISFSSSNSDVANVTSGGIVIPISKGEATITAYYEYDNKTLSDSIKIEVNE